MTANTETFKKYKTNNIFIETGSYIGDGINQAIEAGYNKIISIELGHQLYEGCVKRFKDNDIVSLFQGDSSDVLNLILKDINSPATFWLDGHWSGGITARGKLISPIMQELDIIKNHTINTHTILIDDMRCWQHEWKDFSFGKDEIEQKVKQINDKYIIEYVDGHIPNDILVAYVKEIK